MGRKPAYSSRTPPSLAKRVNPETRPVAYPRWETSRMRVASRGVSKMSAKNLRIVQCLDSFQRYTSVQYLLSDSCSSQVYRSAVSNRTFLTSRYFDEFFLPELVSGKLCPTLCEVSNCGGSKPCKEASIPFCFNDMPCAGDK